MSEWILMNDAPDLHDLSGLTEADLAARRQRADALHRAGLPSPYPECWGERYIDRDAWERDHPHRAVDWPEDAELAAYDFPDGRPAE